MRLGFHYHVPASSIDGDIYMPGFQGRFIDSLAAHCEHVVCFLHSPLPDETDILDYRINAPNVILVDIGPHVSVPQRLLRARRFVRPIREQRGNLDALLVRGPTPLLPFIARAAAVVPLVLLLVGDYLAGIEDLQQPCWRKEAVRLLAIWNKRHQNRLAGRHLTFVNSRILHDQMHPLAPRLYETHTTTLREADFFRREDTCGASPYHLLYTGRLAREKGLTDIIEALAILTAQGEDVMLNLVGWPAKNDNIMDELETLARAKGVTQKIRYHGFKSVGPDLFACYQQADIYVLASWAEGFPRTIWEAMAHSLPVVATKVGSIPDFIQGAAELVDPRRPDQLAAAISRIIHDVKLRRGLINQGLALASEKTLEFQVAKMMETIKEHSGRRE